MRDSNVSKERFNGREEQRETERERRWRVSTTLMPMLAETSNAEADDHYHETHSLVISDSSLAASLCEEPSSWSWSMAAAVMSSLKLHSS